MKESKPPYNLYREGIEQSNKLQQLILNTIKDSVLVTFLVIIAICLNFEAHWLAFYSITLVFIWSYLRYFYAKKTKHKKGGEGTAEP